jgi:sodium-dependent dicarboxylate transporter 2/3/5
MRHHLPDVVLMDLEMPGMDGPTTLEEIRKHWGPLPVILHTGHVDGPLLTRALEWSPFTVLAKPCPMEQLVRTVRDLGQGRAAGLSSSPPFTPCPALAGKETVAS